MMLICSEYFMYVGGDFHLDIAEASMQAFHSLRFCSECMMNNIVIKAGRLGLNFVPSIAVSLSSWERNPVIIQYSYS